MYPTCLTAFRLHVDCYVFKVKVLSGCNLIQHFSQHKLILHTNVVTFAVMYLHCIFTILYCIPVCLVWHVKLLTYSFCARLQSDRWYQSHIRFDLIWFYLDGFTPCIPSWYEGLSISTAQTRTHIHNLLLYLDY